MNIKTLLIANRGEIACRIANSARKADIIPVAVHSEADASARHVREIGRSVLIGKSPASESYLNIAAVLNAARQVKADAIHPGYGFLSENPDFASAVEATGMAFVGPTTETLTRFGDKASAKEAAIAVGVPVISGPEGARSDAGKIYTEVLEMGLPVLLKAVGGGGGRGQRLVQNEETLRKDIEGALREARSTFGSEGLLLERFLPNARHVEIQIAGDGEGQVLHLFERDCTLQRRHQKIIEEAPAPNLPRSFAARMASDAVKLGKSLNYRGLGTVEFLVANDKYFFLEVNPRLQVEHPVTEAITGLDLVELQLRIASGNGLGLTQDDIAVNGHAVEARLYAEDPKQQFTPSTGRINSLSLPQNIRIDSGVDEGDEITPYYDAMIAKMIAHADNRSMALSQLSKALDQTSIAGIETNCEFLGALVKNAQFKAMEVHTRWIDACLEDLLDTAEDPRAQLWNAIAAALYFMQGRLQFVSDPWQNRETFTGWRLGLGNDLKAACHHVTLARPGCEGIELRATPIKPGGHIVVIGPDEQPLSLTAMALSDNKWHVTQGMETFIVTTKFHNGCIQIAAENKIFDFEVMPPVAMTAGIEGVDRSLTSPLTGMIIKLLVSEGEAVKAGDTIAILESMKLEISVKASVSGLAKNISIEEGSMVDRGQVLAEIIDPELAVA